MELQAIPLQAIPTSLVFKSELSTASISLSSTLSDVSCLSLYTVGALRNVSPNVGVTSLNLVSRLYGRNLMSFPFLVSSFSRLFCFHRLYLTTLYVGPFGVIMGHGKNGSTVELMPKRIDLPLNITFVIA